MYCRHCGTPAATGRSFCGQCSRPLDASPPQPPHQGYAGTGQAPPPIATGGPKGGMPQYPGQAGGPANQPPRRPHKNIRKLVSIVSGIVSFVMLLSSGLLLFLSLRPKTPPEDIQSLPAGAGSSSVAPSAPVSPSSAADSSTGPDSVPVPQSSEVPPTGPHSPGPEDFAWVGTTVGTETWIVPPYLDSAMDILGEWDVCNFDITPGATTMLYMTATVEFYDAAVHGDSVAEDSNMVVTFQLQYQQVEGSDEITPRDHEAPVVCGASFSEGFLTVVFPNGVAPTLTFWPDIDHQRGLVYGYDGQQLAYVIAFVRGV